MPYLIFIAIAGVSVFFLKIAVGQFMRISGIKAWNFVPVMKGNYTHTLIIW
jgi:hypothetical protein